MVTAKPLDHLVLAEGPNVRIRLRVRDDGPDAFRWRSDPETARFDGRTPNKEPFAAFLDAFGHELAYGRNDREQFAIDTLDGQHIGTLMFYNFGRGHESCELGISLGEEGSRGRGLGREAVIVALRWVWNNRPVRTVFLHALDWNERAIRCFLAAGFDETARVYRDGQPLIRMEVKREWWLLWEMEGRFNLQPAGSPQAHPEDKDAPSAAQA